MPSWKGSFTAQRNGLTELTLSKKEFPSKSKKEFFTKLSQRKPLNYNTQGPVKTNKMALTISPRDFLAAGTSAMASPALFSGIVNYDL